MLNATVAGVCEIGGNPPPPPPRGGGRGGLGRGRGFGDLGENPPPPEDLLAADFCKACGFGFLLLKIFRSLSFLFFHVTGGEEQVCLHRDLGTYASLFIFFV